MANPNRASGKLLSFPMLKQNPESPVENWIHRLVETKDNLVSALELLRISYNAMQCERHHSSDGYRSPWLESATSKAKAAAALPRHLKHFHVYDEWQPVVVQPFSVNGTATQNQFPPWFKARKY